MRTWWKWLKQVVSIKSRAGQLTNIFLLILIQLQMNLGEGRCGRIIKKVIAMTKTSSSFVRKNVVVNIYHANPLLLTRDIGIYGRQLYAGRDIGLVVWYLLRVEVVEGSIPSCPHWFFLGDNTSTLQIMDWSQTKSLCSISTYGWPDLRDETPLLFIGSFIFGYF